MGKEGLGRGLKAYPIQKEAISILPRYLSEENLFEIRGGRGLGAGVKGGDPDPKETLSKLPLCLKEEK